jgi:hypothetical protein
VFCVCGFEGKRRYEMGIEKRREEKRREEKRREEKRREEKRREEKRESNFHTPSLLVIRNLTSIVRSVEGKADANEGTVMYCCGVVNEE